MINRLKEQEISRYMKQFPVVAIIGPRQCGKTTIAKELYLTKKNDSYYFDLESPADKSKFIAEAYRLLKKGGRLIMADFFKQQNLSGKDAALITQWANGWAIDDFATIEKFTEQLTQAGFTNTTIEDVTDKIIPSAKRLYRAYFPGVVGGFLYKLFNPKPTVYGKKNIDTAYLQYKALKKNLWTYKIVLAEK